MAKRTIPTTTNGGAGITILSNPGFAPPPGLNLPADADPVAPRRPSGLGWPGHPPGQAAVRGGAVSAPAAPSGVSPVSAPGPRPRVRHLPGQVIVEGGGDDAPPPVNPFRQAMDRGRALRSRRHAKFLESLPNHSDPTVAAGRAALADKLGNEADLLTGGAYLSRDLAVDDNARANALNTADVSLAYPATAAVNRSIANLHDANARGVDAGTATEDAVRQTRVDLGAAQVEATRQGVHHAGETIGQLRGALRDTAAAVRAAGAGAGKATPAAAGGFVPKTARDITATYELIAESAGKEAADKWLNGHLHGTQQPAPQQPHTPAPNYNFNLPGGGMDASGAATAGPRNPDGTPMLPLDAPIPRAAALPPRTPMLPLLGGANAPAYQAVVTAPGDMTAGAPPVAAPRRPITPDVARQILAEAGGDRARAKQLAEARGYDHAVR